MGDVVRLSSGRVKAGKKLPKPRDCEECEEPIETARLQAVPGAKRCVSCEGAREARLRRQMAAARPNDVIIIRGR